MEDDHIKREAAWNGIYNCHTKRDADGYIWVRTIDVAHMVDDLPAADVRPVVRAVWLAEKDGVGICSNCKRLDHIDPLARFCRFCGADMREERTE